MATMGNLFSGSGAWELAAKMCGIDVVFEAEIEPFPVALEAKRFPEAIQLGDVSKINGADIPPVDIFTNSSPCQGLSVAGGRKGLGDERSGLFREAIRITKEMRDHDRSIGRTDEFGRPRSANFWCWENVPGALSSGTPRGADFREVLESIVEIVQEEHPDIPIPPGGWHNAGVMDGDGWQIAWRIIDSQFYGVAQRRRRLFLVADFAGYRAGEILFERAGVPWHFTEIASAWKDTSRSLDDRIAEASRIIRGGVRTAEVGVDGRVDRSSEPITFAGVSVTSPLNVQNPMPGDPCHALTNDSRNYLVRGNSQKN